MNVTYMGLIQHQKLGSLNKVSIAIYQQGSKRNKQGVEWGMGGLAIVATEAATLANSYVSMMYEFSLGYSPGRGRADPPDDSGGIFRLLAGHRGWVVNSDRSADECRALKAARLGGWTEGEGCERDAK